MNRNFVLVAVIFAALLFISASLPGDGKKMQDITGDLNKKVHDIRTPGTVKPDINFGKTPLYFISNKGQVNAKAEFYAKASRYTLWLTKEGLVFDSMKMAEETNTPRPRRGHPSQEKHTPPFGHPSQEGINQPPHSPYSTHSTKIARDVSRLIFLNANKNPEMVPINKAKLRVNYFIGNDKSKWNCDVPTSMAVLYKNLYKNVDLKVYGLEKQIEYDWIVKPGGNHGDIRFEYKNVKGTRIDEEGNLLIETDFGELMHKKPVSYQERTAHGAKRKAQSACPEERKYVNVTFKKIGKSTYGFEVGEYDKNIELIIDPVVLAYSTYLGGNGYDEGYEIAVDSSGYVYVVGVTSSSNFPILNQYQGDQGSYDVFVTRLDTNQGGASGLIYSTYLGGGGFEYGYGIAVDGSGNAYVTGQTGSGDFPTLNQYQGYQGYADAFVTKLDTTQSGVSSLLYSTYLGGGSYDGGFCIAVDISGNAYVTGVTISTNFPALNQYQTDQGGDDVFVTRLDTTQSGASSLLYSTYLGGGSLEYAYGIAVDGSGNAYVTGVTSSTDFPTLNQYQTDQGGYDVFVTRLNTNQSGASSLLYSTYLGGENTDWGFGIAVDGSGNAYVTGGTGSTDFPALNQYQTDQWGDDVFVTRLDTTKSGASSLLYSTYLGGGGYEEGFCIAVDISGNVYVTGHTGSTDFPTLNQYQGYQGYNSDVFVTKLDTTQSGTSGLLYSTYLGGENTDWGFGIAVDGSGNAYVTGFTYSTNFPTLNQYQTDQGGIDAFVTKLTFEAPNQPPAAVCKDAELAADENCQTYITASDVNGGSYDPDEGDEITLALDNTGPFSPGTHYVELTVTDESAESDSCFAQVTVKDQSSPVISISDPLCVQTGNGKGNMANKLSLTAQDNCSDTVDLQILNLEVYNNGGNPVSGNGIFEVKGNDIYIYPDGNSWSLMVTIEASDASGNTTVETFFKNLLKCK
jgi:hypothetical protein